MGTDQRSSGPIQEEIDELRRKLQLLGKCVRHNFTAGVSSDDRPRHFSEGDKKAYLESSQTVMQQNKETIAHMRGENKRLRAQLAERIAVCFIFPCPSVCLSFVLRFLRVTNVSVLILISGR